MGCGHKTCDDFITCEIAGRKVWKCSSCESESVWSENHTALMKFECSVCDRADYTYVACSDKCRRALKRADKQ